MRPPGCDGGGGGVARPATGTEARNRSSLGGHHTAPGLSTFFPGDGGRVGDSGVPARPTGGSCGGDDDWTETGANPGGLAGQVQHRLVPDLHPFFPVMRGPVGDCGGWPATGKPAVDSDDPIALTQLADETWMGRCMVSLIAGTQESVNYGECVHSPVTSAAQVNLDVDQVQEQFMEEEEGSDEESDSDVDPFIVHCEGDTDVEELYPTPTYAELAAEESQKSKEELHKEIKGKQAKLRAVKTRKVKKRAADYEAGVEDKGMTFSDQDSEDCRDLSDSSDDDGVVPKTSLSITKRKSRANKLHRRIYYDESRKNAHDQICLHMCFTDVHQCRRALVNHHIHCCRNYEYLENTPSRIVVCCKSDGTCPFTMTTSIIKGERTHCIRQLVMPHTCGTTPKSSRITSEWIGDTYEESIKTEPDMKVKALIAMVKRDYGVVVTKHMAYRAKNRALENVEGHQKRQYLRIRDYLQTVIDCNPGSRCVVQTIVNPDPQKNPRFHGLFFCLHAQVQGFLEGCRPFIGVDGCFIKLTNGAQILAATARDGNNNLYPLAFGIVGKEETSTWCWFLMQLRYALGGGTSKYGHPFTIMSDRQKGLLKAVSQIFPKCEQRFCLRHIYANFQLAGFRGGDLKKLVDAAAYAFTKNDHLAAMQKIREDSEDAWKWLSKIPTKYWARHAMDTTCKTDLIVNNISEVFNNYILEQRDKPIGTMIEQVRLKLQARYATHRSGVANAQWEIAPHYVERLEIDKRAARYCESVASTDVLWQVSSGDQSFAVDLDKQICGCFRWQFTGMPCKHAISAIYARHHDHPEDHVSDFFKKPCYQKAYQEIIFPVPGQHDWTNTNTPDIEPPVFTRQPGRKKKKRRLGPTETGYNGRGSVAAITCSNCKLKGHRYTTCTLPLKSHLLLRKQQHKSNRRFPGPFVPPAASTTTEATASAASSASTTTQAATSAASATRQTSTHPHYSAPRAPWIPPRQGAPTYEHPQDEPMGGGYRNSRLYSYFTPGLDAMNRQEEDE